MKNKQWKTQPVLKLHSCFVTGMGSPNVLYPLFILPRKPTRTKISMLFSSQLAAATIFTPHKSQHYLFG